MNYLKETTDYFAGKAIWMKGKEGITKNSHKLRLFERILGLEFQFLAQ